ncbi:NAD(P)-dependent oxidoreductase [Sinorhizobium medicae]|nr:NAD(P)-dependent oxidoreductase [Sinorhizobium medicae]
MGAGFAGRFSERGVRVVTVLEGRSEASAARAKKASMECVEWEGVVDAELFISLVPPAEALPIARRVAAIFAGSRRRALYADLNAINPKTAETIAEVVQAAGLEFADGGICGAAPAPGGGSPAIYTSGPGAERFGYYRRFELDIRVMDAPVGAASAVKMCQASVTKGYTALASIAMLAAMRFGAGEMLREELMTSRAGLYEFLEPATLRMFRKAYRFVGEMHEIADFMSDEVGGRATFETFAEVYRHIANDYGSEGRDVALLRHFYEGHSNPPATS